ncbi:MAG: sigma-54 dependent transcriptional regulator [Planctomycetota bacterium]|nr:sigma-54 dependent transcriptional regulator [Planctomycetota bacterium]
MSKEPFSDVLLSVWREACRHIEIRESTASIAALLAEHLPIGCLLVRRVDVQHNWLDTVALGQTDGGSLPTTSRTTCTPEQVKRFGVWAEEHHILQRRRFEVNGDLAEFVPPEFGGEALVGPLQGPQGPTGILVAIAEASGAFLSDHLEMMEALLEPFSAALENDRRLHELAALREAAEADRRSLLSRLGRGELRETIVGADGGLRLVMERARLVAQSDVPVLILGETGTGKEVVSRAIHDRSARSAGPFIRVNCGAIPPELIDSQLFGHERGSFTGASDTRKGWFERADGGTLFLDEIGELPLPAQVRLLRVLQDGYIERVGGQQPIHVDVRMVAATHRDLPNMVQAGTFREDLWYRIAVFPIVLPRLCERAEDIPALARHFAERAATRFGLAFVEPNEEDLRLLMSYAWPGNIRELGTVLDRAAILGDGKSLEVATALGAAGTATRLPVVLPPRNGVPAAYRDLAEPNLSSLDTAMRQHIERALAATQGRIEGPHGTAAILKINPHTLRARMRKLGVDWGLYRSHVRPELYSGRSSPDGLTHNSSCAPAGRYV